jgi:hypothetical protein
MRREWRQKQAWDAVLEAKRPGAKLALCPDPAPDDALRQGAKPGFWHVVTGGTAIPLQNEAGMAREPGRWMLSLLD